LLPVFEHFIVTNQTIVKDTVHATVPKMPFKFMAVLLTYFDVLPILFGFEKRCACDQGTWTL
jgi:hypothetical protein